MLAPCGTSNSDKATKGAWWLQHGYSAAERPMPGCSLAVLQPSAVPYREWNSKHQTRTQKVIRNFPHSPVLGGSRGVLLRLNLGTYTVHMDMWKVTRKQLPYTHHVLSYTSGCSSVWSSLYDNHNSVRHTTHLLTSLITQAKSKHYHIPVYNPPVKYNPWIGNEKLSSVEEEKTYVWVFWKLKKKYIGEFKIYRFEVTS